MIHRLLILVYAVVYVTQVVGCLKPSYDNPCFIDWLKE